MRSVLVLSALFFLTAATPAQDEFEMPISDERITWDDSQISLFYVTNPDHPQKKLYLSLKGQLTHSNPRSFTLQAEGMEAMKVNLKGKSFQEKVEIPKIPNKVRLWLEHLDGKAVKVSTYEVVIRSKPKLEISREKLINY